MGGQICVDVGVVRCHFCSVVRCPTRCVTLHSLALAQLERGSGSSSVSGFGVTGAAVSVGAAGNAARSTAASAAASGSAAGGAAAAFASASAVKNRAAADGASDAPDDELDADGCGNHLGHCCATVPRGRLAAGLDWTGGWTGGPTGRGWTGRAFGCIAASVAAWWQGHAKPICESLQ